MMVLATAGHVDHGKSTLLRALTGMEPDRTEEERRRGLSIDLGFVWTTVPGGPDLPDDRVAFVDVPGHERFLATMLAGAGPVPAVLFAVAADGGWMPQSQEHAAALDALGVRDGLLVVTRRDLADPGPALARARTALAGTGLAELPAVAVSARTGQGLDELRTAIAALRDRLPAPRTDAPVRLWADRAFTRPGHGLVVTGTLRAGTLAKGDVLHTAPGEPPLTVRGLEELGRSTGRSTGPARVAVALRGEAPRGGLRGTALCAPGTYTLTGTADVRFAGAVLRRVPPRLTVHIGSAAVPAEVRRFGRGTARLVLGRPLPLRIGDRMVVTEHRRVVGSAVVLDPLPPYVGPRRAGGRRADALAAHPGTPDLGYETEARGLVRAATLSRIGVDCSAAAPVTDDWLVSAGERRRIAAAVTEATADGEPVEANGLIRRLGLPDRALLAALLPPERTLRAGRIVAADRADPLPAAARALVESLEAGLGRGEFLAPTPAELTGLGVGRRDLALAVGTGRLVRLSETVHVAAGVPERAADALAPLAEYPFTVSEARIRWNVPRRIALPLIEHLDRAGVTRRGPDDRRTLSPTHGPTRENST
ncbi:SelB C-terminal domain-containing protein [Streptomyces qinzhouensis]|uniref:Selenocysteine-specific translation elongation factor n=1 Tax=Streptomyces qinzhouensis TaxID=2599401 RepID=A0A5B8J7B3_9ACTN|nr:SelB C-terminal domain-containing protein [Streptomyces qinzhouensis]QDY77267.1 selenocysteine-specific translation elongation factor [Streptomyces qinzhouensis]